MSTGQPQFISAQCDNGSDHGVTHDAVPQIVFDLAISMYANTNTTYKDCENLS